MSPLKRSLAGLAATVTAGAIIIGAAFIVLGFPAWSLWGMAACIGLMWLSARPGSAPFVLGIAVAICALYFGVPFAIGQIAKGLLL